MAIYENRGFRFLNLGFRDLRPKGTPQETKNFLRRAEQGNALQKQGLGEDQGSGAFLAAVAHYPKNPLT